MGVGLFGPPVPGAPWSALAKAPTGSESQGFPAPTPPTPGTGTNRPYVTRVPRPVSQALTRNLSPQEKSAAFTEQRRNAKHADVVTQIINSLVAQGTLAKTSNTPPTWAINAGNQTGIPSPIGQAGKFIESNGTGFVLAYPPTFAAGLYVPTLNPVISSNFTFLNQQSSSFLDATGTLTVNNGGVDVGTGGNDSLTAMLVAAPSTPYTAKALFRYVVCGQFLAHFGVIARNSSSGKLLAVNFLDSGTQAFVRATKWTSVGNFDANYKFTQIGTSLVPGEVWMGIQDDGANLKFLFGSDGQNFIQFTSQSRTDYAVPDQIGFYACVSTTQQKWFVQVLSFTVG